MTTKTYVKTDVELDIPEINALIDAKKVISNLIGVCEENHTNYINCNVYDDIATYSKEDLITLENILENLQYAEEIY